MRIFVGGLATTVLLGVGTVLVVKETINKGIDFYEDRQQTFEQMRIIADNNLLHPSYGNNNGLYDFEEKLGVAKDMGTVVEPGKGILFNDAKRYVDMYLSRLSPKK